MKDRIEWVDWLKCVAMFLVIWGHIIQRISAYSYDLSYPQGACLSFICTFHMPLFTILSGFFFSEKYSAKEFLIKKTKQLLLPLIVWCFLYLGCLPIIITFFDKSDIHCIAIIRNIYYGITDWGWWYLRALFLCFVYSYIFIRIFNRRVGIAFVVSLVFLYSLSFSGCIPNKYPLTIGFVYLYPFFIGGYYFRKYIEIINVHKLKIGLVSLLLFIVFFFSWHGMPDTFYGMNTSCFANGNEYFVAEGITVIQKTILRIILGITASLSFVCAVLKLKEHMNHYKKSADIIQNIGRGTLGIYILQTFIVEIDYHTNMFGYHPWINMLVSIALSFVVLIICYWFQKIIGSCSYSKFLVGKYN